MEEKTATDTALLELLRERGLVPDWAYYQLNGKTAEENYREQTSWRSWSGQPLKAPAVHLNGKDINITFRL